MKKSYLDSLEWGEYNLQDKSIVITIVEILRGAPHSFLIAGGTQMLDYKTASRADLLVVIYCLHCFRVHLVVLTYVTKIYCTLLHLCELKHKEWDKWTCLRITCIQLKINLIPLVLLKITIIARGYDCSINLVLVSKDIPMPFWLVINHLIWNNTHLLP